MFRLLSNLMIIALIPFIGCEPELARHSRTEEATPQTVEEDIDPRCVNDQGWTWKEDCNSCWCAAGRVACTRKMCSPKGNGEDVRCITPFTSWKEDCNTCVCLDIGIPACTRMSCPEEKLATRSGGSKGNNANEIINDAESRCLSGEKVDPWEKDCNSCICIPGIGGACTRKACLREVAAPLKTKRDIKKQTVQAFAGDVKAAAPKGNSVPNILLMSSATQVFPGVWTASAALFAITAILARI